MRSWGGKADHRLTWAGAALVLAAALVACGSTSTAGPGLKPMHGPPVVAFYYPWYGTPEVSGTWRHWNNDGHDPTRKNARGLPDIAGAYHPYPALYDSNDPTVLRRQIAEAEAAGIDAFAVSWWGQGSFEDTVLARMMSLAARDHDNIRFSIYYEEVPGFDPSKAVTDLDYVLGRYGHAANFLRYHGRPVVFVYARAIFPGEFCFFGSCTPGSPPIIDWSTVNAALHARFHAFMSGDEGTTIIDLTSMMKKMGFDGIHMYNPQLDLKVASPDQIYSRLAQRGAASGLSVGDTIIPGYDDSVLGRAHPSVVPRDNGALYTSLWQSARREHPAMYLITTFNEWHEGTAIEPSYEWRDLYLKLTAKNDAGL